jgi:putative membrane protein
VDGGILSLPVPVARAVATLLLLPASLWAHPGQIIAPHDLLSSWPVEPAILIALVSSAALYAIGLHRIRLRAGDRESWRRARVAFGAGWVVLAIALASPLHPLGSVLFSAHMAQHELLMVVAAPLLVLGRPVIPWLFALRPARRRRLGLAARQPWFAAAWHWISSLRIAWCLHAAAVLVWHLPALYDASIRSELAHALQHSIFLGTALLFWWSVLQPSAKRRPGSAVVALFAMSTLTGGLGALLALADAAWYGAYGIAANRWGLSVLEDQQIAGLIMWMGGTVSYLVAALALMTGMLRGRDQRINTSWSGAPMTTGPHATIGDR